MKVSIAGLRGLLATVSNQQEPQNLLKQGRALSYKLQREHSAVSKQIGSRFLGCTGIKPQGVVAQLDSNGLCCFCVTQPLLA